MSNPDRPDLEALAALETVVGGLTDELARWRRRALAAEQRREEEGAEHDAVAGRERIVELERGNAELVKRLEAAAERTRQLVVRLTFLEEQIAPEEASR